MSEDREPPNMGGAMVPQSDYLITCLGRPTCMRINITWLSYSAVWRDTYFYGPL